MERIINAVAERRSAFAHHAFLERLRGEGTLAQVRAVVPRVAFFVLVFQDVLRLAHERSTDEEIRAITRTHWQEDQGHDDWYLGDLEELGVPLDVRWLFSRDHIVARDSAYAQIGAVIAANDDRARLATILALEAAGAECFSAMIGFLERMGYRGTLQYFARSHQHVEAQHDVFVGADAHDRMHSIGVDDAAFGPLVDVVDAIFGSMTRLLDDLEAALASRSEPVHATPGRSAFAELDENIAWSRGADEIELASRDFGGIARGTPAAIVRPKSTEEVVRLVELAAARDLKLTTRAQGLSQSGQSVARHGTTVSMQGLADIGPVDREHLSLRCGPGATWREVLERAADHGLCPKVMPLNLDVSVGGALSAGGLGTASHRFGFAASNVRSLEVVLGTGERVTCGPHSERAIYDTVVGGVGRAGIITEVELELRRFEPRLRTFFLRYDDLGEMLGDMMTLSSRGRADHLEGLCSASVHGVRKTPHGRRPFAEWSFGLHVAVEYDERAPEPDEALEGLRFQRMLGMEDDDPVGYCARYDIRLETMKRTGAWTMKHPWFEVFLPLESAQRVVSQALALLPLALGDGHRLIVVADRDRPAAIALPDGAPAVCFAVLPQGVPAAFDEPVMSALRRLHETCLDAGGKRYPSGWLFEAGAESWKRHYGATYEVLVESQRRCDPQGVFEASLPGLEGAPR